METRFVAGGLAFSIETTEWDDESQALQCHADIRSQLEAMASADPSRLELAHALLMDGRPSADVTAIILLAWTTSVGGGPMSGEHSVELHPV